MDSSLWNLPIFEDDSGDFGVNPQLHSSSCLGSDVMSEEATNGRCCIQMLRRLIPQAAAVMKELEEEIIFLQAKLALEDRDWAKLCFHTLIERIKELEISIHKLKNEKAPNQQGAGPATYESQQTELGLDPQISEHPAENFALQMEHDSAQSATQQVENDMGVLHHTHRQPAPRLTEILKYLLEKYYFPRRDQQSSSSNSDEANSSNAEAIAYFPNSLKGTVEPFNAEVPNNYQNGDARTIDSFVNLSEPTTEVSRKRKMIDIDSSIQAGHGIGTHDSTSKAEKRMYTSDIDKEATGLMINASANAICYMAGSSSVIMRHNVAEETSTAVTGDGCDFDGTYLKLSAFPVETNVTETDMSVKELPSVCVPEPETQTAQESVSKHKLKTITDDDIANWTWTDIPQEWLEGETTEFPLTVEQEDSWSTDLDYTFGEAFPELFDGMTEGATEQATKEKQEPPLLGQMRKTEVGETELFRANFLISGSPELPDVPFPIFDSGLGQEKKIYPTDTFMTNKKVKEEIHPDYQNQKVKEEIHWSFTGESSSSAPSAAVLAPLFKNGEGLRNLQATPKMHMGRTNGLIKEEIKLTSNLHAVNQCRAVQKPQKLISCTTLVARGELECLPMAQLRAMAKERKLKRYSKLNKSDLIKLLEQSF